MAISSVSYTGDGATDQFSFGAVPLLADGLVPYGDQLVVEFDAVVQVSSLYTVDVINEVLNFISPPADTVIVKIVRVTKSDDRYVDWTNSTNLTQEELNLDSDQLLFLSQESLDNSIDALRDNGIGEWDAESQKIISLADGVESNDAVTVQQLNSAIFGGTPGNVNGQGYINSSDGTMVFNILRLAGQNADDVNVYLNGTRLEPIVAYTVADNVDASSLDLTLISDPTTNLIEIVYATGVLAASLAQDAVENDNILDGAVTPDKMNNPGLRQVIINDPGTGPAWDDLTSADITAALDVALPTKSITVLAAPTTHLDMGTTNKIVNLADPVASLDAVNLQTTQTLVQAVIDDVDAAAAWGVGTIAGLMLYKETGSYNSVENPGPPESLLYTGLYSGNNNRFIPFASNNQTYNGASCPSFNSFSEGRAITDDPSTKMDPDFVAAYLSFGTSRDAITSTGGKRYATCSYSMLSLATGDSSGFNSKYYLRLWAFYYMRVK